MMIQIAGVKIKVDTKYFCAEEFFEGYGVEGDTGEFQVEVSEEEIMNEKLLAPQIRTRETWESTGIFRKICLKMLDYHGFFMHSSVIAVDGEAYAFAAKSGTGKSTHTALWLEYFGNNSFIVNGDKPIYRFMNSKLYVCGHPWAGKEGMHANRMVPLKALCFLERGSCNEIRPIKNQEMLQYLFHQLLLPKDEYYMDKFLAMIDQMVSTIPFYVLKCNISEDAVKVAYRGMQ